MTTATERFTVQGWWSFGESRRPIRQASLLRCADQCAPRDVVVLGLDSGRALDCSQVNRGAGREKRRAYLISKRTEPIQEVGFDPRGWLSAVTHALRIDLGRPQLSYDVVASKWRLFEVHDSSS